MKRVKSFDVRLAVKLTVQSEGEHELPRVGDAIAHGAEWLTQVVQTAAIEVLDIEAPWCAADLMDVGVRMLNQSGADRRSQLVSEISQAPSASSLQSAGKAWQWDYITSVRVLQMNFAERCPVERLCDLPVSP